MIVSPTRLPLPLYEALLRKRTAFGVTCELACTVLPDTFAALWASGLTLSPQQRRCAYRATAPGIRGVVGAVCGAQLALIGSLALTTNLASAPLPWLGALLLALLLGTELLLPRWLFQRAHRPVTPDDLADLIKDA